MVSRVFSIWVEKRFILDAVTSVTNIIDNVYFETCILRELETETFSILQASIE